MKLNKLFSLLTVGLILFISYSTNAQNKTTIPLNPAVRHGVLENGMNYYIMHNEEPKERVSYYFVQNVGAILEEDSQDGLAHFLEHMAFNGLENFPGKDMLNYLEKNGIKFGREVNAYTAQDETVYNISSLPVYNENLLDSALLVLHDWSEGLLLEGDEIEAERGVIHEEWRTRRNARFRLMKQSMPTMYNHSKYAKRDVIGSLDVIDNFEHQELRDYYKKWYRPDLQTVIIVGDIDVDQFETKVKNLFSKIPARENAAERVYYPVEDGTELDYVLATDKEAQAVSINWIFRNDPIKVKDENYLKRSITKSMLGSMFNTRFSELLQKPECPAVNMGLGTFNMARTKDGAYLAVSPKEGKELEAFETLMTEIARVQRFGFNESELERTKTNFLRQYESYYEEREKISNEKWAEQLRDYHLKAEPLPSIEWEVEFAKKYIPTVTLPEIYANLAVYQNMNNSLFSISGPEKDDINYPTKEQLLASLQKVVTSDIEPYADDVDDSPLVKAELTEKQYKSVGKVEGHDAEIYELDNGAKIVLYPTELSKDQILFNAFSFGGSSLVSKEDLESANMAAGLAMMSGVSDLDMIKLQKKLAGKIVKLQPFLGGLTEGFSGSASPKDFETLLQLLYLRFEKPRFDEEPLNAQIGMMRNQLINLKADNGTAFKDTIGQMNTNHHPRALMFNEEYINNISFEKASKIYKDRFQDASDFTFIFVGNIDKEKDLPLISKYIGNIPSINREESWVDHKVRPAKGASKNIFEREMEVAKSTVHLGIFQDIDYNLETRMYVRVIAELLSKRYMETIREEEGGSYGVGVRPSVRKLPYEHCTINIDFDTDPAKQERLTEIVFQEIDNMVENGPNLVDLEEIKKNYIKSREESEEQNGFWASVIQSSLMYDEPITDREGYNEIVNNIDADSVKKFAKKLFKNYDSVNVVMKPKESEK